MKFITIGSTTMEDVLFELGEPEARYDGPQVLLYRWVEVGGMWRLNPGLPGFALWFERTEEHTLHIAFDENNRVTRYKISSVELSIRGF